MLVTVCLAFILTSSFVKADFCTDNPDTLFCAREPPDSPADACGVTSEVKALFLPYEQENIVKDINKLRKELAEGNAKLKTTQFPSAGDMIEIQWHFGLEKAAQAYSRLCTQNYAKREQRIVENLTEVNQLIFTAFNTDKIPVAGLWDAFLEHFRVTELTDMELYVTTEKEYKPSDFILNIYGKPRFVGCGKMYFYEEGKSQWEYYVVCHWSPGGLSNSKFYAKGTKPCQACPEKTKCSSAGPNKGVLCAWSGTTSLNVSLNPLMMLAPFLTLIFHRLEKV